MISVCLVCYNEEKDIANCLESVKGFADEIVILDLGSTDETVKICQKFGARIFQHEFVPFVEPVRNYINEKASGDWVLVLDPDEEVPTELKNKLKKIIEEDKYDAVNIPRKNIFFGKWISHTNWWPDKHIRFFKKGKAKWPNEIHKPPLIEGSILDLQSKENLAILHKGYSSISEFMVRQNRYSTVEAQNLHSKGIRFSWRLFFWKPIREFLVRYIKHAGFLDGFYGFTLTILMMIYQLEVMVKLWELDKQK